MNIIEQLKRLDLTEVENSNAPRHELVLWTYHEPPNLKVRRSEKWSLIDLKALAESHERLLESQVKLLEAAIEWSDDACSERCIHSISDPCPLLGTVLTDAKEAIEQAERLSAPDEITFEEAVISDAVAQLLKQPSPEAEKHRAKFEEALNAYRVEVGEMTVMLPTPKPGQTHWIIEGIGKLPVAPTSSHPIADGDKK